MEKTINLSLLKLPVMIIGAMIIISGCTLNQGVTPEPGSGDDLSAPVTNKSDSDTTTNDFTDPANSNTPNYTPKSDIANSDTIDLSNRGLTEFPKDILSKTKTKKLILSNNSLKTLPAEIGELVNLEELYLDNNLLDGALVAEIRKMPKLRILDASSNNMTGIPAEIGQLRNLTTLDFSNNKLDTMPNEIENIRGNLKTLNLSNNKYSPEMLEQIKEKLPNTNVIY